MEHTPGPWKLHKTTTRGEFGWDYKIRSADDSAICTIGPVAQDANAALIAAAPDLLAALKAEIGLVGRHDLTGTAYLQEIARVHALARAVIAKAEGQDGPHI